MFDESTRVPLLIHHPLSPFKGRHYNSPVELVDIFPTINDLLGMPYNEKRFCDLKKGNDMVCKPLQGKSLAPVVLGENWKQLVRPRRSHGLGNTRATKASVLYNSTATAAMPSLQRDFAISQSWRCAQLNEIGLKYSSNGSIVSYDFRLNNWKDCSRDDNDIEYWKTQLSIMGYSMRTVDFRYTAWLPFNRSVMAVSWDQPVFDEELYDHRGKGPGDFTHQELINLSREPAFAKVLLWHRNRLTEFLRTDIVFHGKYLKGMRKKG